MTNIAEILKFAPKGLKLYSIIHGQVEFDYANDPSEYPISVQQGEDEEYFDEYGKYFNKYGECVLFPSSEHRDWKDWQEVLMPQCVGSVFVDNNEYQYCLVTNDKIWVIDKLRKSLTEWFTFSEFNFNQELRFATAEEIEQCFKELDRQGYKFENGEVVKKEEKEWTIKDAKDGDIIHDEETDAFFIFKKLERGQIFRHLALIDGVIHDNPDIIYDYLYSLERYRLATTEEKESFLINIGVEGYYWNWVNKKLWKKEVEKQFTINDLKPFDKVLVRQCDERNWQVNLFSHIVPGLENKKVYFCLEYAWMQCIPYNEETAHLLGTNENYDGPYKTWED